MFWSIIKSIRDKDETKFSKGTSLIPLINDPSTPEWKSAVFWQVNKSWFVKKSWYVKKSFKIYLWLLTLMSKILPLVSSRRLNHPELEVCDGLHDKDQRLEIYGVGKFVSLWLSLWLMLFFVSLQYYCWVDRFHNKAKKNEWLVYSYWSLSWLIIPQVLYQGYLNHCNS